MYVFFQNKVTVEDFANIIFTFGYKIYWYLIQGISKTMKHLFLALVI